MCVRKVNFEITLQSDSLIMSLRQSVLMEVVRVRESG
jgi:hypothetical protein